jgi:hypothetical protein
VAVGGFGIVKLGAVKLGAVKFGVFGFGIIGLITSRDSMVESGELDELRGSALLTELSGLRELSARFSIELVKSGGDELRRKFGFGVDEVKKRGDRRFHFIAVGLSRG